MSETVLKILLSELGTLRIVCKHCQTAMEMSVESLDRRNDPKRRSRDLCCPGCGVTVRTGGDADHAPPTDGLDHLVNAWEALAVMQGNFQIQFVVKSV